MPVTIGFTTVYAGCSMMPSTHSSSMNRFFQNPVKGSCSEQKLNRINDTIIPLLRKSQSLPVICERNRDELPVSDRTTYFYIGKTAQTGMEKERSGSPGIPEMPYRT